MRSPGQRPPPSRRPQPQPQPQPAPSSPAPARPDWTPQGGQKRPEPSPEPAQEEGNGQGGHRLPDLVTVGEKLARAATVMETAAHLLQKYGWLAGVLGGLGTAGGLGLGFGAIRLGASVLRRLRRRPDGRNEVAARPAEQEKIEPKTQQAPEATRKEAVVVPTPSDVRYVPYKDVCPSCRAWEKAVDELVRNEPGLRDAAERLRWYYRQFLSGEQGR